ncbi:hypothetical protein [Aquibacillus salsiterrae]|uniref:EamA family transporter RarD n=1 Tax=Aquibacillus salsiterrae TaxID=2950439 RepID=A0A9X3WBU9_9BACI|nr:hypothetical protein [Aquibacillus salsiterrae]MDC3416837.1 hypothetical protein [Aquibacillus salsiterrae]
MNNEFKSGIAYATSAYLLWGFLPIFWKAINGVAAGAVLAHRIVWSLVFMIILLLITRSFKAFIAECKAIIKDRKKLTGIALASFVIS